MGRVVHFEILASDPERIAGFYSTVFGWDNKKWGQKITGSKLIVDNYRLEAFTFLPQRKAEFYAEERRETNPVFSSSRACPGIS